MRNRSIIGCSLFITTCALAACSSSNRIGVNDEPQVEQDGGPDALGDAPAVLDAQPDHDGSMTDVPLVLDAPPDVELDPIDPSACPIDAQSTIPHVRFEFHASTCTFTLAQAASGISIPYDLVVDQDVPDYTPESYWYGPDVANLDITEVLSGRAEHYCLCDIGLPNRSCPLADGGLSYPGINGTCDPITIPAGVYHRTFTWDGHDWNGPSDTENPKGPLFPAGDYELKVSTNNGSIGDGGVINASARLHVRLIP